MYKSAPFLLSSLMALLIGCNTPSSTTPRPSSSPPLQNYVKLEDSQFESSAKFLGIKERFPGNEYNHYFLRSFVNKTNGQVSHQLYVSTFYSGSWVFWFGANSEDTRPLEFIAISRKVVYCGSYVGCSYTEDFGALIPDTALKTHRNGFSVKFYAKTGREMIITQK
jgi:hypothetical protein